MPRSLWFGISGAIGHVSTNSPAIPCGCGAVPLFLFQQVMSGRLGQIRRVVSSHANVVIHHEAPYKAVHRQPGARKCYAHWSVLTANGCCVCPNR